MTENTEIKVNSTRKESLIYNGIKVEVNTFISFAQQIFLIREYLDVYFGYPEDILVENSGYHYVEAEFKLKNFMIQLLTDIDIDTLDNNLYVDSEFWKKLYPLISNYADFKIMLDSAVVAMEKKLSLDNSVGTVLDSIIVRLEEYLDNLSQISPEQLEKINKTGIELMERLEKSSVLQNPADAEQIIEKAQQPVKRKRGRPKKVK